jgi:large subunit ribosomal protein L1
MGKLTKRQKAQAGKVESTKLYAIDDALSLVKQYALAKFDESIDVAVQLGIDAKKSDQVVRGAVVMPNGTGKTKRRVQRLRRPVPLVRTWSAWMIWLPRSRPAT